MLILLHFIGEIYRCTIPVKLKSSFLTYYTYSSLTSPINTATLAPHSYCLPLSFPSVIAGPYYGLRHRNEKICYLYLMDTHCNDGPTGYVISEGNNSLYATYIIHLVAHERPDIEKKHVFTIQRKW